MASSHAFPILSTGKKSWIHLSQNPNASALVLVHGFKGDKHKTWERFIDAAKATPELAGVDILSWGYDSTQRHAEPNGEMLQGFLRDLMQSSAAHLPEEWRGTRDNWHTYRGITVVAHSLGALISRFAIERAEFLGESWPQRTNLVLYAPAHCGADILTYANLGSVLPTVRTILMALSRYPVLADLQRPEGSWSKLRDRVRSREVGDSQSFRRAEFIGHGD
jgi:hypothetical protein